MTKRNQSKYAALVEAHTGLVHTCAFKTYSRHLHLDDKKQIGFIGLLNAASSYKSGKGKFTTYAWFAIRNEIVAEERKISADYQRMYGTLPEDIFSQYWLERTLCSNRLVSFEQLVRKCRDILDPMQYRILSTRLGLEGEVRTLCELAEELGIAHESVRRIEKGAIDKVRECFGGLNAV